MSALALPEVYEGVNGWARWGSWSAHFFVDGRQQCNTQHDFAKGGVERGLPVVPPTPAELTPAGMPYGRVCSKCANVVAPKKKVGPVATTAIVTDDDRRAITIPDERVFAMIRECTMQIRLVSTLKEAKETSDVAEAIAAITRKVNVARETKLAAVRLLIEAETRLGEISRGIPHGTTGGGQKARGPRKSDVLRGNGISKSRANCAERLSTTPPAKVEKVIAAGANTIHGIYSKLDLHADGYVSRQKKAADIAFLCQEAIELLGRSARANKVPHMGTVAEMERRWRNINAHGNTRT